MRVLPRVISMVLLLAAATTFCAASAGAQAPPPDQIPIAQFIPLPPASEVAVSPEARAARERILGDRALDPDFVTLQWFGVSSFIVTVRGHLLLFDAWEIIGLNKDYVPIGREDLAALDPEAILVGHGHFDHAADAGYIAGRSGATVVGSEEICATAKEDAARDGLADAFTCAITGTMETPLPGTARPFRLFADVEPITVLQHIHSDATPPSEDNPPDPFLPVFDPTAYIEHINDDPAEVARFLETLGDAQGGTWMYHFRVGDFTLLVGDSAGPIFTSSEVRAALDAFPGCVDVMANAILGFDQPVSGMQDPRLYVEHAHPKVFLPTHGDAWAPVISGGQAQYRDEWASQMAGLENPPQTDFLLDPDDYLAERAYAVADPQWTPPMPGSSCAAATAVTPATPAGSDPAGALPATGGDAPTPLLLLVAAIAGLAARGGYGIVRTGPSYRKQPQSSKKRQ